MVKGEIAKSVRLLERLTGVPEKVLFDMDGSDLENASKGVARLMAKSAR